MSSPTVPAGRESAPTQTSQPVTIPTSTPQSNASSTDISTSSAISVAFFLSLFALLAALVCICCIRRRRAISKVSDERPSEKEAIHDVEALAVPIPVTPVVDVRWAPQIRSISGPKPDQDMDRKSTTLFPKRARSPPPSNLSKPRSSFPDSGYPKSAPVHVLSFPQHEMLQHSAKLPKGELSPPVTPSAVAVSGMETRSLGRPGVGSKN